MGAGHQIASTVFWFKNPSITITPGDSYVLQNDPKNQQADELGPLGGKTGIAVNMKE